MLKYLIISAIFWFNPLISNIDILPDLVGYILIIKAFSKMSYLHDYAGDVCKSAKKMCIVSGAKILSIFLVSSFDPTMSLLLSFTFAIFEMLFGIPFFIKLFNAISRFVPADNYEAQKNEGKTLRFTVIALVLRLIFAILPDLTALSLNSAFTLEADFTYMRFRPLFIGFFFIISLAVNVIWIASFIQYFKNAISKEVVKKCREDFDTKVKGNTALFVAKNNIRALVLISIGSLFAFDLTWGYSSIDIFQDFVFTSIAFLSVSFLAIKKAYKIDEMYFVLLGATILHIVANIFEASSNERYFEKYNLASILKISKAEDMYSIVTLSGIISAVSLVCVTFVILLFLKKNAKECMLANPKLFSETDIDYFVKDFEKKTNRLIIITMAISAGGALVYSLMVALRPYTDGFVLVDIGSKIAFIFSFIITVLNIHDDVYKRISIFA